MLREINDPIKVGRNDKGVNKKNYILQRRSERAGDCGYTAYSGRDSVHGCLATAFSTLYSGNIKTTYIKDRLFAMRMRGIGEKDFGL